MTFKTIPTYPLYEINEDGVVRNKETLHIKKPNTCQGYPRYSMWVNGKSTPIALHILLMDAYVGPPNGRIVRHLDGNPTNNTLSNLAYGSYTENQLDTVAHGRTNQKMTHRKVKVLRGLAACGFTRKRLMKIFNLGYSTVCRIINRQTWIHTQQTPAP